MIEQGHHDYNVHASFPLTHPKCITVSYHSIHRGHASDATYVIV